jgi:hypothetical protein
MSCQLKISAHHSHNLGLKRIILESEDDKPNVRRGQENKYNNGALIN